MADTTDGPPHNQDPRALPGGARVQEYEILRLAEGGGFSLVYLARDLSLGRQVALKEYMPPNASRAAGATEVRVEGDAKAFTAGMRRFMSDARLLAQFDQPGLVKVHRSWEDNGTAYMTMPFYEGVTLQRAVAEQRVAVDESALRQMLAPLLDALTALHDAQCHHHDISPDNVLLTANGRVLLDFGAARTVITNAAHSFHVILKEGYAPLEQYAAEGGEVMRRGPWSDIYALCAVLRYAITGVKPHSAVVRSASRSDPMEPLATAAAGRYSEPFLRAIDAGMTVAIEGRPQSIAKLRELLAEQPVKPDVVLLPPGADLSARLKAVTKHVTSVFEHPWARKAAVAALLPVIVLGVFLSVRWRAPAQPDAAYAEARSLSAASAAASAAAAARRATELAVAPRPTTQEPPGPSSATVSAQAAPLVPGSGEGTPEDRSAQRTADRNTERPAARDVSSPDAPPASTVAQAPPAPDNSDSSSSNSHSARSSAARSHKSRTDTPKPEPRVAVAAPPSSAQSPPVLPAVPPPLPAPVTPSAGTPGGAASASPAAAAAASAATAPVYVPPPAAAAEPPPTPVERDYRLRVLKLIQEVNMVPDTPEYRAALAKLKSTEPASVSFVLDRAGKVIQAKIDQPTGSEALDRLAVRMVSGRRYPPFPDSAWPGKPNHSFSVPFKFR